MTAPAADPRSLQIMDKLCAVLANISQANGYYNNVVAAGIEPLAFDDGDMYPQIVVQEASSSISESKSNAYQDDLALTVFGFVPIVAGSGYRTAMHLRDDITAALQQVRAKDFLDAQGFPLVRECALAGPRAVTVAEANQTIMQVAVTFTVTYRQFFPPTTGTN